LTAAPKFAVKQIQLPVTVEVRRLDGDVLLQDCGRRDRRCRGLRHGVQPVAIKAADLDGDGKLDLLTANFGAAVNPGTQGLKRADTGATAGTFLAPAHYATGFRSTALAVGDLKRDGKPDVAVACEGLPGDPGTVSVFLQTPPAACNTRCPPGRRETTVASGAHGRAIATSMAMAIRTWCSPMATS